MKPVTKAVIAAAGFGTRFLPQTKAMPKEMLPIIDKPIIQYVVEELVEAGIKDIIIVGSSNKRAIEDHFDEPNADLLANLRAGGPKKQPYIDLLEQLSGLANFVYIRQKGPYGNATPIINAAHLLGDLRVSRRLAHRSDPR
jgi:UTP--glucose-1-phosphate uridylyltransferase